MLLPDSSSSLLPRSPFNRPLNLWPPTPPFPPPVGKQPTAASCASRAGPHADSNLLRPAVAIPQHHAHRPPAPTSCASPADTRIDSEPPECRLPTSSGLGLMVEVAVSKGERAGATVALGTFAVVLAVDGVGRLTYGLPRPWASITPPWASITPLLDSRKTEVSTHAPWNTSTWIQAQAEIFQFLSMTNLFLLFRCIT